MLGMASKNQEERMKWIGWVFWIGVAVMIGIIMLQQFQLDEHEEILGEVVILLEKAARVDSLATEVSLLVVGHINTIYEYLGVGEEIRLVKQDTTIDSSLDSDTIPLPAGYEQRIKQSVQKIRKPKTQEGR